MTTTTAPAEFDLCGPLPSGVLVLEASAGTGKTYAIAGLAARYVANGLPLDRLLLITFTRMATGELRDRVREKLSCVERELARIAGGANDSDADPIVTLLASGTPDEIETRRAHLERAVADFDAATIATTHGFCQEILAELGTVGELEPGTAFVEDTSDLVEEVLDDLYVRRFQKDGKPAFRWSEALSIARAAVGNPMAELEPRNERQDPVAAMRYRLACKVREELELRKRRLGIMDYDDLLTRLNNTLGGPNGADARARLRARFDVVLVDEFQDTDPIQWQILHRAFASQGVTLVLIADPKQAIYAFRGADVYAYLLAEKTADDHSTLRTNRRSDQPLLDAYDALFGNATLGHEGIVYRQVRADEANKESRLSGAPNNTPLRIRVVIRDQPAITLTNKGFPQVGSARECVASDVAVDIVRLLSSGAKIKRATGVESEVSPGDIAVLVRTNSVAEMVADALRASGVPAVINGAGSVFATDAATYWLRLLSALEQPQSTSRAKAAALTPFLGWEADRLAAASPNELEDVHARLHRWSRILRERGVAAMAEAVIAGENLPARMLGIAGGERLLTDIRHLVEILHQAASAERLGVTALRGWLAERVADATLEEGNEERARRLESDTQAIQVLTIHRSKGLEFPIVYCPYLWDTRTPDARDPVLFHDPDEGDRCKVDVGLKGRTFEKHRVQGGIEHRGEELRLMYVALTRAKHQAVIWWVGSWNGRDAPLTRLVFAKREDGTVPAEGTVRPQDAAALERFREVAAKAPSRISVEESVLENGLAWTPPPQPTPELVTATFDRHLDLRWRRTSYSDITADAHDPLVASEPEERVLTDEPESPTPATGPGESDALGPEFDETSLWETLPVGTAFGTFVHRVLEATDFVAADLESELAEHVTAAAWRAAAVEPSVATGALAAAIETPLGPALDGIRLRDIAPADRLGELEFELPLVGGDDPTGRLTLDAVADVLKSHTPAGDPMRDYAARLADPALRSTVRGFLTGSIDLVMRLAGPRFVIVDYKTNWLGPVDEPLTLRHYTPHALADEMNRAQYGLQALLYTVALHRYLRWRVRDYDPERHLGGALYLFLRGMTGAGTPTVAGAPCGVFAWRPTGALVNALSDVLDQGAQ